LFFVGVQSGKIFIHVMAKREKIRNPYPLFIGFVASLETEKT
jgi:hypothetical protein